MLLPHGTMVAVADGAQLHLFRNGGNEAKPKLTPLSAPEISGENKGSGKRHHSSSANPDDSRLEEDSYAAATAAWLNQQALGGKADHFVVIASPKTLGELRKHYHKGLEAKLLGELAKELTGHGAEDIEAALANG